MEEEKDVVRRLRIRRNFQKRKLVLVRFLQQSDSFAIDFQFDSFADLPVRRGATSGPRRLDFRL